MNIFRTSSEASSLSEEEVILASERPKKRAGRRVFNETRHPVYRGVRRRNNNKWVCEMRVPGNNKTRIWLGTYPTPEMAARAHDVAALALRGKSACLNFADSAWRLSLPVSTDAASIRKAAMEAAEAFAAEDNLKQQNVESSSTQYDEDCMVMEDANKGSNPDQQQEDEVAGVSEYENMNDLILSIANEPLRSPLHFARDGGDWNDVDRHDAEVSLWSFSF